MTENIYTLIPKIREEVGAVRKDQTAQAGARYSYRSGDQVINALVPILNKYGVFTTVEDIEHELTERVVGNKVITVSKLRKIVTFYAPDGSSVSSTVAAESSDYADKATGAAQAYAYRYALLQTFTLPTDETDPDAKYEEKTVDSPVEAKPKARTAAQLKSDIKAAAQERDMPRDGIEKLGNKMFDVTDQTKWNNDTVKLQKVLYAIVAGEVA